MSKAMPVDDSGPMASAYFRTTTSRLPGTASVSLYAFVNADRSDSLIRQMTAAEHPR